MIEIVNGPREKAGTWRYLANGESLSASFSCPECGLPGTLEEHDIGDDGTVAPSVVCPSGKCSFHGHIKLVGWNGAGKSGGAT